MLAEKQEGCSRRITVGADKAYDTKDFVSTVRELNVTPHVTRNDKGRTSNLDRRTTRQPGYAISLSRRWLIEKGSDGYLQFLRARMPQLDSVIEQYVAEAVTAFERQAHFAAAVMLGAASEKALYALADSMLGAIKAVKNREQ